MSKSGHPPRPLYKQLSWSPDTEREETWLRLKGNSKTRRLRRVKSVTDEDLEELKACIELGFGFEPESPDLDPKLSDTFPALGFYCAVNKQYSNSLSRSSSASSLSSDGSASCSIVDPGDAPEMVKTKLRQWAQVVACSVRQCSVDHT
ncbi:hypothetical protein K2173_001177 [Erythroxylum novogranatense]|uniref:Uncharacterized protein n=1 Tax=Erythroxylum novogranatense TaxID=1862640 RepID=A0AAV8TIB1_9ROSI|nr:hypothetical protein K2173_001177 [Erythroxylum novogranatense]